MLDRPPRERLRAPVPAGAPREPAPSASPHEALLELQRTHGNRWVRRLVEAGVPGSETRELEGDLRSHVERRMGGSLGPVRTHTGAIVDAACETVGAAAFTLGNDVFLRREVDRGPEAGRRHVLAHEAAHVFQQSRGAAVDVGTPALEAAAEGAAQSLHGVPSPRAAESTQRGTSADAPRVAALGVQRMTPEELRIALKNSRELNASLRINAGADTAANIKAARELASTEFAQHYLKNLGNADTKGRLAPRGMTPPPNARVAPAAPPVPAAAPPVAQAPVPPQVSPPPAQALSAEAIKRRRFGGARELPSYEQLKRRRFGEAREHASFEELTRKNAEEQARRRKLFGQAREMPALREGAPGVDPHAKTMVDAHAPTQRAGVDPHAKTMVDAHAPTQRATANPYAKTVVDPHAPTSPAGGSSPKAVPSEVSPAAVSKPSMVSRALRFAGSLLAVPAGVWQAVSGAKAASEAKSATDTVLPGLEIGAGTATAAGGIGELLGLAGLSKLGQAGLVLGSGLLGYHAGKLLAEKTFIGSAIDHLLGVPPPGQQIQLEGRDAAKRLYPDDPSKWPATGRTVRIVGEAEAERRLHAKKEWYELW